MLKRRFNFYFEALVEATSTDFYFLLPWKLQLKFSREVTGFRDSFYAKPREWKLSCK